MGQIVVGVGGIGLSKKPEDVIKTYALGSCVALIFYAQREKAAALAHIALPDSKLGNGKAKTMPGYFADTAIPILIEKFKKIGIAGNNRLTVKLAGGANILDPAGKFNIGKRNVLAIKKLLWRYHLGALAEDVGQSHSRTVTLNVKDGEVTISSPNRKDWKI